MPYIVNIFGSINSSHTNIIQTAVNALAADKDLLLEIHIDSAGGDPDPAKHIYDLLENYRDRTTTIAEGKCMSSALIIFLSADTRLANSFTDFMIHPTSWKLWGVYDFLKSYSFNTGDLTLTLSEVYTLQAQLNKAACRLTEIEDYTDKILRERTNLTNRQFHDRRFINTDQHLTPAESLKFNISTKII